MDNDITTFASILFAQIYGIGISWSNKSLCFLVLMLTSNWKSESQVYDYSDLFYVRIRQKELPVILPIDHFSDIIENNV